MNRTLIAIVLGAAALPAQTAAAADVSSAPFTYQGQLKMDGVPVTDICDFEFTLWNDEMGTLPADQVGAALTFDGGLGNPAPISVVNGLFTAQLDFGARDLRTLPLWLEVAVSCPTGAGMYTPLVPRNPITMAPHAANTRGILVTRDGEVGLGDVVTPDALLHIDGGLGDLLRVGDNRGLIVSGQGDVGIGTTNPSAKLEVSANTPTAPIVAITGLGGPMLRVEGGGDTMAEIKGVATNSILSVTGRAVSLLEVSGRGTNHGNHIAFFDSFGTPSADGIAIRLGNANTNRDNNFVTFLNGQDLVTGRIEGFDLENFDWVAPPPLPRIGVTIDPAISYNPNWLDLGALPTATLTRGTLPSLSFTRGSLPTATLNRGTFPTLSVTGGALPTASLSAGQLPSLTFNDGSVPSFSATTTTILGVRVMTGFSFSAGSTPSATFNDGSLPSLTFNQGSFPNIRLNRGTLPSLSFSGGSLPFATFSGGSLPSLAFDGGSLPAILASPLNIGNPSILFDLPTQAELDALYCWAFETGTADFVQLDPVSLAVTALKQDVMKRCKDEGVTYGSKGADYAEWLPKLNPSDRFQFGQIVGVHGGRVSLKTEGAEQIMAISRAPVVIGNVPAKKDEHLSVTVGFMGQLPVVVHGPVHAGDYIIPSGKEDGTAVAISPDELQLKHLGRTLGRAWSDSTNDVFGLINVAIGLNGNEPKIILERQQQRIEAQSKRQVALAAENTRLAAELTSTNAKLASMMTMLRNIEEQLQSRKECAGPTETNVASR